MDKISKLIRSALNNSSANEAAQALKIAAATMQKEGVNPSEVLQKKGEASTSTELEKLRAEHASLRNKARNLLLELNAAKRNPAELREAKILAVKWHRAAHNLEKEKRELTLSISQIQQRLHAEQWANRRYFILGWIVCLAGVAACFFSYEKGRSDGMNQGAWQFSLKPQTVEKVELSFPPDAVFNAVKKKIIAADFPVVDETVKKPPAQRTPAPSTPEAVQTVTPGTLTYLSTLADSLSHALKTAKIAVITPAPPMQAMQEAVKMPPVSPGFTLSKPETSHTPVLPLALPEMVRGEEVLAAAPPHDLSVVKPPVTSTPSAVPNASAPRIPAVHEPGAAKKTAVILPRPAPDTAKKSGVSPPPESATVEGRSLQKSPINAVDKAVCYSTNATTGAWLKYSYTAGKITVFVKSKNTGNAWLDITDQALNNLRVGSGGGDGAWFIREIKGLLKGEADCKRGVSV